MLEIVGSSTSAGQRRADKKEYQTIENMPAQRNVPICFDNPDSIITLEQSQHESLVVVEQTFHSLVEVGNHLNICVHSIGL